MPEVGDHYIGVNILLPRGDLKARCYVVAQSHDANGNVMGKVHANTILDTKTYQVEFAGGKITELTASSLPSQCIPNVMQMEMSIYSYIC